MTLHRREFLSTSAIAAGATTLFLPQALLADDAKPASANEQIRIAMIGVGGQGSGNMRQFMKNVVAVCDVDSKHLDKAAEAVAKANGKKPIAEKDYRKILERKDIDAVCVSTPDHWHALCAIDACNAGKDVYVEKPMTLAIAEGRRIVKAARKNNRIVQCGSQQRSAKEFRLACELVRNGKIGKIKEVRVGIAPVNYKGPPVADAAAPAELDYELWLGPAPLKAYNEKRTHYQFRFFWDYAGGQVTNWGAHHLDIAQWGLGMDETGPVAVEAKARFHMDKWYEVSEWCEILYTYANGITMTCGQSEKGGTTFIGDKGTIHVNRGKFESSIKELADVKTGTMDVKLYESGGHHKNFLECMKSRKLPICDAEIGHRSATVCHLGNLAIRTGRKLTWDPEKEQILNDKEANAMVDREYRSPWKQVS